MPIEYMRQEPSDVQEYYLCPLCHEEKHMDDFVEINKLRELYICNECHPGDLHCVNCNDEVLNDVLLWLACYCKTWEMGSDEPFPDHWRNITTHEPELGEGVIPLEASADASLNVRR